MRKMMMFVCLVMLAGRAWGDKCLNPSGCFGFSEDRKISMVISKDPKDLSQRGSPDRAAWHFHWLDASFKNPIPISGVLAGVTEDHRHFSVMIPKKGNRFILFDPSSGSRDDHRPRLLVYDVRGNSAQLMKGYTLEELLSKEELEKVSQSVSHIQWISSVEEGHRHQGALYDEDGDLFYIHTAWMTFIKIDLKKGTVTRGAMKE